ncbi:MAG TPA: Asp-tRNA(Asn)/Glu-tRNA(Gln) amidotransferase GatCAB subunit B, partial [Archaeoglobus veneficus]|nr:Asp-tRNA(Asn)/Glu-tRNA(Gln) amidotransferase GatCAB subunit B [Archaeoglobus veneficus]
ELNYRDWDFKIAYEKFKPEEFAELLNHLQHEKITEKGVVEVIRTKLDEGGKVDEIIKNKGLFAIVKDEIEKICKEVIEENPKAVEDYKNGKKQALNFLVGQVMKKTRGKAKPAETAKIIQKLLQ